MSNKNEFCKARGDVKSRLRVGQVFGQRSGKTMATVVLEVCDEMTIHPPASKEEVQAFLRLHLKRCRVNLANAKDRGDTRAQANLARKLACYEYLEKAVAERQQANKPSEAIKECPECRVYSVDIFGHCSCCGKNW